MVLQCNLQDVLKARLLIMEMTFLDDSVSVEEVSASSFTAM